MAYPFKGQKKNFTENQGRSVNKFCKCSYKPHPPARPSGTQVPDRSFPPLA